MIAFNAAKTSESCCGRKEDSALVSETDERKFILVGNEIKCLVAKKYVFLLFLNDF